MIITIHDSRTTASIDTMGAQLISMKDASGKEYIWQRDPDVWPRCSPLLFPVVGNCRGGKTLIDGAWYEIEKHGFCKTSEFEVAAQSDSHAVFRLTANDDTRRSYPYDFSLTLTYHLTDGVLSMDYAVENRQDSEICYCIGAHPGFICPLADGERFEDYRLEFEQEEDTVSMVYDARANQFDAGSRGVVLDHTRVLPLDYELFCNDAVYFDQIRSRRVSLVNPQTGKGVAVAHPGFESVAFWTPYGKSAPFLCIEPWNGSAVRSDEDDELRHRHHIQVLGGGETKTYRLEIEIL